MTTDESRFQELLDEHVRQYHANAAKRKPWRPPTLEEVQKYITEHPELKTVDAKTFWTGFNDGGWVDTQGKPVRNWKLKLRTWASFREPGVAKQPAPKQEIVQTCYVCNKQRRESQMVKHPDLWAWICREHGNKVPKST